MRRALQSRINGNIKLLRLREWTHQTNPKQSSTLQRQSRSLFGKTKTILLEQKFPKTASHADTQIVYFTKTRLSKLRDNLILFGVGVLVSFTYNHLILQPIGEALDDPDLPEIPEDELSPIFIPLPLSWRIVKQDSYRGSDPEWQEFVKFSKQQDLAQRIRHELARYILDVVKGYTPLMLSIGNDVKLRRYWLDVDFPSEPPPEYVQSGIEIGNDYIAYTHQPVDSMTVRKYQRALWPSTMSIAIWSFTKVVFYDFLAIIANTIGFKTERPPTIEELLARHRQLMRGAKIDPSNGPSLEPQLFPSGTDVAQIPSITQPKQSQESSEDNSESGIDEIITDLQQKFSRPLAAFKKTFAKNWKEPIPNPPRGCLWVSGLVELDTPKAYLVFDVRAHWDPLTRTYDKGSMQASLRRIQPKKQGPKGS